MGKCLDPGALRAECAEAGVTERGIEILLLRAVERLSFDEIGERLGKKRSTVYTAYSRASDRLRMHRERRLPDVPGVEDETETY